MLEKLQTIIQHIEWEVEEKGENVGIKELRKHMSAYIKNMPNATVIRQKINTIDTKKELIARLRALPDDDRQLIMRRFYFGQAYKDIAASLGISEAAARKRCERLLKKLAEQIEEVS